MAEIEIMRILNFHLYEAYKHTQPEVVDINAMARAAAKDIAEQIKKS